MAFETDLVESFEGGQRRRKRPATLIVRFDDRQVWSAGRTYICEDVVVGNKYMAGKMTGWLCYNNIVNA